MFSCHVVILSNFLLSAFTCKITLLVWFAIKPEKGNKKDIRGKSRCGKSINGLLPDLPPFLHSASEEMGKGRVKKYTGKPFLTISAFRLQASAAVSLKMIFLLNTLQGGYSEMLAVVMFYNWLPTTHCFD